MSHDEITPDTRPGVTDAGRMCFSVAAGAFAAALLGAIVNSFLTGWMAVGGMASIGLLYLGMGLAEVRRVPTTIRTRSPQRPLPADVLAALRSTTGGGKSKQPPEDSDFDAICQSVLSDG